MGRAFPFTDVAEIAMDSVAGTFDPLFAGDRGKTVFTPNSSKISGHEQEIIEHLLKEVQSGRMAGPFPVPPFPSCRVCKLSRVLKFKWDRNCSAFRLISDFSAHGTSSVNDLCWSPELLAQYFDSRMLASLLAFHGPGAFICTRDIPKCFRAQKLHSSMHPLCVYYVEAAKGEGKYFVDFRCPFGLRASEYQWQCCLAVVRWQAKRVLGSPPFTMVDNFHYVHRLPGVAKALDKKFEQMCAGVAIAFHEVQQGTSVRSLGWEWHTLPSLRMVCPLDKYNPSL